MITTTKDLDGAQRLTADGRWVPAKPLGAPGMTLKARIKGAWLVLVGKAAAVRWE